MLWWALPVLALAAAAAAFFVVRRRAVEGPAADWSVQARRLLTPAEHAVYARVGAAFPQQVVFVQVSFDRLLGMRRSHGSPAVFQRYARLVADCVICSRELMPLVVLEFKNAPQGSTLRTRAEASKAEILRAAGLVYVTIDVSAQPDEATLRAAIRAAMPRRGEAPARTTAPAQPAPPAARSPAAAPAAAPGSRPAPAAATATAAQALTRAAFAGAGAGAAPPPVRRIARTSAAPEQDAAPADSSARPPRVA